MGMKSKSCADLESNHTLEYSMHAQVREELTPIYESMQEQRILFWLQEGHVHERRRVSGVRASLLSLTSRVHVQHAHV